MQKIFKNNIYFTKILSSIILLTLFFSCIKVQATNGHDIAPGVHCMVEGLPHTIWCKLPGPLEDLYISTNGLPVYPEDLLGLDDSESDNYEVEVFRSNHDGLAGIIEQIDSIYKVPHTLQIVSSNTHPYFSFNGPQLEWSTLNKYDGAWFAVPKLTDIANLVASSQFPIGKYMATPAVVQQIERVRVSFTEAFWLGSRELRSGRGGQSIGNPLILGPYEFDDPIDQWGRQEMDPSKKLMVNVLTTFDPNIDMFNIAYEC
jgi:hypothetical protein